MTNPLSLIDDLGEAANLLLAPDDWLENQRINLQTRMSILAEELYDVLKVQRAKIDLQQKNMVAVRCFDKIDKSNHDMTIKLCTLSDAMKQLDKQDPSVPTDISEINTNQQLKTWQRDGYDLSRTKKLTRHKAI